MAASAERLKCSNKSCEYLVSTDSQKMGSFCCKKCHAHFSRQCKKLRHGICCEERVAPQGRGRAPVVEPKEPLFLEVAVQQETAKLKAQLQAAEQKSVRLQRQLNAALKEAADLKGQLQAQNSISGLSLGACWQYEMNGCWEAFAPEGNEKMHQAYLDYLKGSRPSRSTTIISGGVARMVDFDLMQQTHLTTQNVRRIRLLAGVPPQWETGSADLLQQGNEVEPLYREARDLTIWSSTLDILFKTGHAWNGSMDCFCMSRAQIISVHRIENFWLWHRYKARLAAMRQDHARCGISVDSVDLDLDGCGWNTMTASQHIFDCGEPLASDVGEKILLHGTSWDNADSIVRDGFDHRTCQSGLYGAGVYFACAACKSHQYTCEQHKFKGGCRCNCQRTLIIARVALGDAYVAAETRKKAKRPPLRGDSSGLYDSIAVKPGPIKGHHNIHQLHQEFVIFDGEQAYPSYVVQYTI
eukprot:s4866_g2.t1